MGSIDIVQAWAPDVLPGFEKAYAMASLDTKNRLSNIFDWDKPAKSETNTFVLMEGAPVAVRWEKGTPMPEQGFKTQKFQTVVRKWAMSISVSEEDKLYDQTNNAMARAQETAQSFADIPWRVFNQIILGSANNSLLPYIPNAADGVALYSATNAAGGDRYGASGGNIVTQTGTTGTALQTDFLSAVSRAANFQNTNGEELFPGANIASGGVDVVFGPSMLKACQDAFGTTVNFVPISASGVEAYSSVVAAGTQSNRLIDNGWSKGVRFIMSQKITTNRVCLFFGAARQKPFHTVVVDGGGMKSFFDEDSAQAMKNGKIDMGWREFKGYGLGPAYGTITIA